MRALTKHLLQLFTHGKMGVMAACLLTLMIARTAAFSAESDGRWAILVAGISGEPELQSEYRKQLRELRATLEGPLQFRRDQVYVLFDDPSKDTLLIQHQSTWKNLEIVCREIAPRATKDGLVFVFLLGHGSFDGGAYKLNLVGPDPTVTELAAALYSIPAQTFVIVNSTTCSGASIAALSGKGKILITATKSGNEKNQAHFGGFFVEAVKNNNADVDKNGRVTILEAFHYASKKVEEYYFKEGTLQTEHPVLDDNGDGQAHASPDPDNGDGFLARTTYLDAGAPLLTKGPLSPEQRQLALETQSLEKQIDALKYAKSDMPEAEYERKLEELLLKLAQINAKLRKN